LFKYIQKHFLNTFEASKKNLMVYNHSTTLPTSEKKIKKISKISQNIMNLDDFWVFFGKFEKKI